MTNEKKIESMLTFYHGSKTLKDLLLEMARWKDEQFINFLEWIDNVYILRRFSDGESIDFKGLVEKFKLTQK
jgi:hypothetical protein